MTDGQPAETWQPGSTGDGPLPGDRFVMDVVDISGRASEVEFKFRRDSVEVWHGEHCCAALERDHLREWFVCPWGYLVVDEVTLSGANEWLVVLSLPDVPGWIIPPGVLAQLRERV